MTLWDRARTSKTWLLSSIAGNPAAWIFFVLFLIVEHANYQRGTELARVCELIGPHTASYGHPQNAREEIDTICAGRESDDE
jgi:hypothetical protein